MRRIWKYPLHFGNDDRCTLVMPRGAQFLKISPQYNLPTLWVLADPGEVKETRIIQTFGTGFQVPDGLTYIESLQMTISGTEFVWHFFEVPHE